jgi:CIC family chloride channel protein
MGFFCALVGVTFTIVLYRGEDLFDCFKFPEYLKAVLGGLILGAMGLIFPQILGIGYGAINLALLQKLSWGLMSLLVIGKILATSITIGSGGSGGIFAPSLFIGSMAGGFFGGIVHHLFPAVTASPGAYSIVGMGAVVAATTHGPLSAILMLFEMTGDYKIILPLMITCIISRLMAGRLLKESIYTFKLIRRGVDIRSGKEVNVLKSISVKDVMNQEVETILDSLSLRKFAEKISKTKYNSFPVVNGRGHLTGVLSFLDYNNAVFNTDLQDLVVVKDLATQDAVTVSVDDNIYTALEKISSKDFSILPVVAPDDHSQLLGVLTRKDILDAYDRTVIKKSMTYE